MTGITTDIKAMFLEKEDCDAGTVQRLRDGLSQGTQQYKSLREAVDAMHTKVEAGGPTVKKWHLKLGVANWFLGAHPTGASPDYGIDLEHLKTYVASAEPQAWADYRARFVDVGPAAYLEAVGGAVRVGALPAPVY